MYRVPDYYQDWVNDVESYKIRVKHYMPMGEAALALREAIKNETGKKLIKKMRDLIEECVNPRAVTAWGANLTPMAFQPPGPSEKGYRGVLCVGTGSTQPAASGAGGSPPTGPGLAAEKGAGTDFTGIPGK